MADERLTADEVAAMRADQIDIVRVEDFVTPVMHETAFERWSPARIVATLEHLMAENERLKAQGEKMARALYPWAYEPKQVVMPETE